MLTDRQIKHWYNSVAQQLCDNCMTAETDRDGYPICWIDCPEGKEERCSNYDVFMELWEAYKDFTEFEEEYEDLPEDDPRFDAIAAEWEHKEEAYRKAYDRVSRACDEVRDYDEERRYA